MTDTTLHLSMRMSSLSLCRRLTRVYTARRGATGPQGRTADEIGEPMQVHGLDEAAAVFIATAIDMHDKQTTDRRFRKKIAARLMELLDNPDYAETLKHARTTRKSWVNPGISPGRKPKARA